MTDINELQETVTLLHDKASRKRRSAAKRLRKLKSSLAGPYLLSALKEEVRDPRTWETQYQMIMALAECEYLSALPFLQELVEQPLQAAILYISLGDAIIRLSQRTRNLDLLIQFLEAKHDMLVAGGIRAIAMLKIIPNQEIIERIIRYARNTSHNEIQLWTSAAAAGWQGDIVDDFLEDAGNSSNSNVRRAAQASKNKKYLDWHPL